MSIFFIGWLGSCLVAGCVIPEVYNAYKTGRCGLTWGFLTMWFMGEVLILIPVMFTIKDPFLVFNYLLNIVLISYLVKVKYKQAHVGAQHD